MNKNALSPWVLSQVVLSGLGLFLFHALITKQYRGAPLTLAAWLAAAFILVLVIRRMARNVALDSRSRWQQTWAGLDEIGLAFVAFFFLLLVVFDNQYFRATADGREYFAHVRSLVIDFDLDFANENELFRTGGVPQHFPFGSAVLWLPFYLVAHLWLGLLNLLGGSFDRDGFHNTYQMAIGLGTLTYGFIGLLMIYRIGRDYFASRIIAAATMLLTAGSFLVWYLAIESSYTHGNSMFAVTLFLLLWYRTRDERSLRQWGWLGLAAGLMVMVRWQNALFLLFPAVDAATMVIGLLRNAPPADEDEGATSPDTVVSLGRSLAVFGLGLFFGFLPQMIFWRVVNGGWLALPHGQAGQQWWSDSLMVDVLFSSNHGLFAWHPIIYLAILGIPLFMLRDFCLGGLLTLVFLIQIYVNGAVATWWGGHAFGGRRFASCTLLFALGLAAFIRFLQKRPLIDLGEAGDERYLGRGWSRSQRGQRGSFRWGLGPESVVMAPLKAPEFLRPGVAQVQPDYLLRFRADPYRADDGRPQIIEFWVNGKLVGREGLLRDLRQYEVEIPGRVVQRNLNEIVMRYSHWRPDPGVGSAASRRQRAVRFDRIDLIRQSVPFDARGR